MAAVVIGLGIAATTACLTASSLYRTHAIVGMGDGSSPTVPAATQAAAAAAVSKPVMMRAASLIGTSMPATAPSFGERVGLILGLEGVHATGRDERLAESLADSVGAAPGFMPGTVEIAAAAADAEQAAQIATTVAEAFVTEAADTAADLRRKRDIAADARLDALRADARTAHQRFAALGGDDADPIAARAAASAQTAAARERATAIRTIVASGTPPIGDRRDLPATLTAMQNTYLDLTRRLAEARETLGDRHTTVVSLQDGIRHAATNLSAEWKRLSRTADAELAAAQARESALHQPDTPAAAARHAALEEARRAAQIAEETLARAEAARRDRPADEPPYRLVARAPVPLAPSGVSLVSRTILVLLAGGAAAGLALTVPLRRRRPFAAEARESNAGSTVVKPKTAAAPRFFDPEPALAGEPLPETAQRTPNDMPQASLDEPLSRREPSLAQAMRAILPLLDAVDPRYGARPTAMVAANEVGADTTAVALALGKAAAARGRRVLLVESERERPELAAAADPDAEPMLVDLFGTLRIALQAEGCGGVLTLVPAIKNGARLASTLARTGETVFIDDVDAAFDLIVVDGGRAAECAAAGWGADVVLRVGRFASQRDDDHFIETIGASPDEFIGTIVASTFIPRRVDPPIERAPLFAPRMVERPLRQPSPLRVAQSRPDPIPATKPTARRRVVARQGASRP